MKKKKSLVALLLVALIGVVGGTFAYFQSQGSFANVFQAALYKVSATDTFTSPENWMPGDTVDKVVYATNEGSVDAVVRVSYEEEWLAADGETVLSNEQNNESVATLIHPAGFSNNWITDVDSDSGITYYYYKHKITSGQSTPHFIDQVQFRPDVEINVEESCTGTTGAGTRKCTYTSTGYGGAQYTLTITVETAQYSDTAGNVVYKDIWGTDVNIDIA